MRTYKQYCGVAKALDLVGQRWTLLIVRDLLPGPRRFTDLSMPGLTPNVLSERLKAMAEAGLIEQAPLRPSGGRKVWQLTAAGRRLEPVVLALGSFGGTYLGDPAGHTMSARWMLVSLQRRYRGGVEPGEVQLSIGADPYVLEVGASTLVVRDGTTGAPRATVTGPPLAHARLFVRNEPPDELEVAGDEAWLGEVVAALDSP